MSDRTNFSDGNVDLAQAAELAALVDMEARWENLRTTSSRPADAQPTIQGLQGKQKAYEAYRGKLAAYNKRYTPAHVPELLLNTPIRLGSWCRAMRDLYVRVEHNPQTHCPAHFWRRPTGGRTAWLASWARALSTGQHRRLQSGPLSWTWKPWPSGALTWPGSQTPRDHAVKVLAINTPPTPPS